MFHQTARQRRNDGAAQEGIRTMMSWLREFIDRRRLKYIGTVEGLTCMVDREGRRIPGQSYTTYWLLYQSQTGRRTYQVIGRDGDGDISQSATRVKVEVKAWVRGGPFPHGIKHSGQAKPIKRAQLITFPGGKA